MRRVRLGWVALVGAVICAAGGSAWLFSRPPVERPPPEQAREKPPPPPPARRALGSCAQTLRAEYVLAGDVAQGAIPMFLPYLVAEHTDRTTWRLKLTHWILGLKASGNDILADLPTLSKVLYRARPFEPPYSKKNLPRDARFERHGVTSIHTSLDGDAETTRLSFSLPASYPTDSVRSVNAVPPFPTLVLLHDLVDYEEGARSKDFPGAEVIRRRYAHDPSMRAVMDEWILFAPVSTKARFHDERIRRIVAPFAKFWKRYHVDFDRVVLDGGDEVLRVATSIPVFFAGVVVRGDPKNLPPALGVNIAHLPVYVVGTDDHPAAQWLRGAGLEPNVGPAEGVAAFLRRVCEHPRIVPTEFDWHVETPNQQILAHWINLNAARPGAHLHVRVDPTANTIHVAATDVDDVTFFLNERIVDLDRPVSIVANGEEIVRAKTLVRDLDVMFENDRLSIRKSQYYGWLYPVLLERLKLTR